MKLKREGGVWFLCLGEMDEAEAQARARVAGMQIQVIEAINIGEDSVGKRAGHYEVLVDIAQDGTHHPTVRPAAIVLRPPARAKKVPSDS